MLLAFHPTRVLEPHDRSDDEASTHPDTTYSDTNAGPLQRRAMQNSTKGSRRAWEGEYLKGQFITASSWRIAFLLTMNVETEIARNIFIRDNLRSRCSALWKTLVHLQVIGRQRVIFHLSLAFFVVYVRLTWIHSPLLRWQSPSKKSSFRHSKYVEFLPSGTTMSKGEWFRRRQTNSAKCTNANWPTSPS